MVIRKAAAKTAMAALLLGAVAAPAMSAEANARVNNAVGAASAAVVQEEGTGAGTVLVAVLAAAAIGAGIWAAVDEDGEPVSPD
ncbi:hypothetical protein FBR43_05705 [Sphingomonas baiyangensis]|uniref:Uncharacterized protein n=2 Tax=Sphingomonas baiyangensis TaxID=2572576 RepID=A0A4U1L271_9SPHN|nr:hypothetical protein FBR43_05705 [Sphingomonas baiyangensis]